MKPKKFVCNRDGATFDNENDYHSYKKSREEHEREIKNYRMNKKQEEKNYHLHKNNH
mgnify:CR=1 FL=1